MKVIANPSDSVALTRIINVPKRNIGETTVEKLMTYAQDNQMQLYDTLTHIDELGRVTTACKKGATEFHDFIERMRKDALTMPLQQFVEQLINDSGYLQMILDEIKNGSAQDKEMAQDRLGNLSELVSIVKDFEEEMDRPSLADFLQEMSLLTDVDKDKNNTGPRV
jgi:DNA helicase-2/ATP-dependent DNA helicase PcrA